MSEPIRPSHVPADAIEMHKIAPIYAIWHAEPFTLDTQEGPMVYSPDTCDDWEGGYWEVHTSDGSKPWGVSPSFMRDNYAPRPADRP